jgi:hypothetical protein
VSKYKESENYRGIEQSVKIETEYEYNSGRIVILRNLPPTRVITIITDNINNANKCNDNNSILAHKNKWVTYRALCAYVLRVLCGLSYKQICNNLCNMTVSGCASLCSKGMELIKKNEYACLFSDLMCSKPAGLL